MAGDLLLPCLSCDAVNRVEPGRLRSAVCGRCRFPLAAHAPRDLTAARFEKHKAISGLPILADFWSPSCGPCRMMAPSFEEAAASLYPNVRLVKINTEQEQMLASQMNIRSIPTLVLFHHGREVARISGAMNAEGIAAWTRQNLR